VFVVFCGVVFLCLAQVSWWIYFLTRISSNPRHVFMFASEGLVFVSALLLGVWIIYGALHEQVRLRHLRATFFSAVTHELRSPLAAVRLLLETMVAGRVTDLEKQQDLAGKMLLDVDRLERLVTNLLQAGQLEAARLETLPERADLSALVRDVVEAVRPRLFAAGDAVTVTADVPVPVEVDPGLFRGVVENLLENASKYGAPPRTVEVSVRREGRMAYLSVRDEGVGLDAEARAMVFRPFYRAGDEETRSAPGTGLGLFLVHGIVEAHGGTCEVLSKGPGEGTTLRIRIPLASTADVPAVEA
jgi:signal transduction histidine kinase